jgi:hypothetical protein
MSVGNRITTQETQENSGKALPELYPVIGKGLRLTQELRKVFINKNL